MRTIQYVAIAALASAIASSVQAQSLEQTKSGQITNSVWDDSPSLSHKDSSSTIESSHPLIAQQELSSSFVPEVTKEQWEEIYHRHYHRDNWRSIGHDNPLRLEDIVGIIGFWGEQVWSRGGSEKWRWSDAESRKRIEIIFIDGEMHQGSAIGL